ncbi:hypothetical protein FACS189413_12390 [Bacteroidia bacterium]|nr:hypothetical protein FACS189413_12390 [Bacteroidia bacterium]
MKNLDLNAYGVSEMNGTEMQRTDGGFWQFLGSLIVAGAVYDLLFHTGDTVNSYKKGADAANAAWN